MIALSTLWFFSAWMGSLTRDRTKDAVFGAPVWVLLLLVLIPFCIILLTVYLLRARWEADGRLQPFDYCGLIAGFLPFAVIVVLSLIPLFKK